MSRRAKLPGAAELFRVTGQGGSGQAARQEEPAGAAPLGIAEPAVAGGAPGPPVTAAAGPERERPPSEVGPPGRAVRSVPSLAAAGQLFAAEEAVPLPEPASLPQARRSRAQRRPARAPVERRPTGRERHEEKITVYVSSDELLDLERARLTLRGDHGLAVDRGRIVREAVAVVLADLEEQAEESVLVRRLRDL